MLSAWCHDALSATLLIRILGYLDGELYPSQVIGSRRDGLAALGCTDQALRRFIRAYESGSSSTTHSQVLMIDFESSMGIRWWDLHNEKLHISGISAASIGRADASFDLSACIFPPLYIAKTPRGKGWGLYSTGFLPKGAVIGCYCGEVIRSDECTKRQHGVYDPEVAPISACVHITIVIHRMITM
jgi:hypothetical protein